MVDLPTSKILRSFTEHLEEMGNLADLLNREDISEKDMIFFLTVLSRITLPEDHSLYKLTQHAPALLDLWLMEYTIEESIGAVNSMDPGHGIFIEGPNIYIYRANISVHEYSVDAVPGSGGLGYHNQRFRNRTVQKTVVLRIDDTADRPVIQEKDGILYIVANSSYAGRMPEIAQYIEHINPIPPLLDLKAAGIEQHREHYDIEGTSSVSLATLPYKEIREGLMTGDVGETVDNLGSLIRGGLK